MSWLPGEPENGAGWNLSKTKQVTESEFRAAGSHCSAHTYCLDIMERELAFHNINFTCCNLTLEELVILVTLFFTGQAYAINLFSDFNFHFTVFLPPYLA